MRETIRPNTFLIGVQKAATTSVFNWLSQHPEICGPLSVKDLAFFTRDEMFLEKGLNFLDSLFKEEYNGQKIILQGSVHYIYFKKAIERIKEYSPGARFILILRDPVDRAISAYRYAKKFNYEKFDIIEAFEAESERLLDPNVRIQSELTYKTHGLYYSQITEFLKFFPKDQLCVLLYEDVKLRPEWALREIFEFLEVDTSFKPVLKLMNHTGTVRSKKIQRFLFGDYPFRNFIVRKILPFFIQEKTKAKLRWLIVHLNTQKKGQLSFSNKELLIRKKLMEFFADDINKLEQLIDRDLSAWKRHPQRNEF